MKNTLRKILQGLLKSITGAILKKYKPEIVGVTGSFGKTSAKEAIFQVLSVKNVVRQNIKNYNNEIGLPLTIIGSSSGGRSILLWLSILAKAIGLLAIKDKNYPKILVLEMAVDRPGDMEYLTKLAPCHVGVVTAVGSVHAEYFKTIEKIAKEKSVMVSHLAKNDWAILNYDNQYVAEMKNSTSARTLMYGFGEGADVRASEINIIRNSNRGINEGLFGLNFKLTYGGSTVPVFLPNILGEHFVYAALSAAAVGIAHEMNLLEIAQNLQSFLAPKGRMNIISGIKDTLIIDDTYNAGPDSMLAAVKTLGKVAGDNRKIAVLGDMLELGDYTEEAHQSIGRTLVESKIDMLITVGERAKIIAGEAEKLGMDKDVIFSFSNSETAGRFVQDRIESGDYILAKGSQGMRMEKVVKEIMAEPLKAKDLLVRQDKTWQG